MWGEADTLGGYALFPERTIGYFYHRSSDALKNLLPHNIELTEGTFQVVVELNEAALVSRSANWVSGQVWPSHGRPQGSGWLSRCEPTLTTC